MNALVIYDSKFGNTEQVARAIAEGLEPTYSVRLVKADRVPRIELEQVDLLVVGGPTHRHGISEPLAAVLDATARGALKGAKVAAFDTRYHMSAWLSGSAAGGISRDLRKLGGRLTVPAMSFFIARDVPPKGQKRRHELEKLEPGELERATACGAMIASSRTE